jgi:antitoxin ParD1/3/4
MIMERLQKLHLDLPAEIAEVIDNAVDTGEFASASDMVSSVIALWRDQRPGADLSTEDLRRLVEEGESSGEPVPADVVYDRIVGRLRASRSAKFQQ